MPMLPAFSSETGLMDSSGPNESEYLHAMPEYSLEVFFKTAAELVSDPQRGQVIDPIKLESKFWEQARSKLFDKKSGKPLPLPNGKTYKEMFGKFNDKNKNCSGKKATGKTRWYCRAKRLTSTTGRQQQSTHPDQKRCDGQKQKSG